MAVLFDLDGTLVDSAPAILSSLRHVERTLGCPPDADLRWALGPPLADIMRRLLNTDDPEHIAQGSRSTVRIIQPCA
jgi:phosphoglycolate phosphatase